MKRSKQLWNDLVRELAAFSLLVASIVLLWRHNLSLFVVVLVEGLAALGLWHNRHDLSLFLIIAVLGSLAEAVFVHFGVWRYPFGFRNDRSDWGAAGPHHHRDVGGSESLASFRRIGCLVVRSRLDTGATLGTG